MTMIMIEIPGNAVLVGPWCAGKTTLGKEIAASTDRTVVDLDDIAPDYWAEIDFTIDHLLSLNETYGIAGSEARWEEVRSYTVGRVLEDHPQSTIVLGAAYTNYTAVKPRNQVYEALSSDDRPIILVTPNLDTRTCTIQTQMRAQLDRGHDWVAHRKSLTSWAPSRIDRTVADGVIITDCTKKGL